MEPTDLSLKSSRKSAFTPVTMLMTNSPSQNTTEILQQQQQQQQQQSSYMLLPPHVAAAASLATAVQQVSVIDMSF